MKVFIYIHLPNSGRPTVNNLGVCSVELYFYILITRFLCRYRQKAGFASQWEPATLTRWREPASSVIDTRRLMKGIQYLWKWRHPKGAWGPEVDNQKTINRSGVYIYKAIYIISNKVYYVRNRFNYWLRIRPIVIIIIFIIVLSSTHYSDVIIIAVVNTLSLCWWSWSLFFDFVVYIFVIVVVSLCLKCFYLI